MAATATRFDLVSDEMNRKGSLAANLLWCTLAGMACVAALVAYVSFVCRISVSIQGSGFIEPGYKHAVRSPAAGIIRRIHYKENEIVQSGELVAEIYDPDWDQDLTRLQEEIGISQSRKKELALKIEEEETEYWAALEQEALGVEKLRLGHDQVLAERQLALIRSRGNKAGLYRQELHTAERQELKLKQEIAFIEARKERGALRAPHRGRIVADGLDLKVGKYVAAGEEITQLAAVDDWIGTIYVSENDRIQIKLDLPVRIYVKAFPHTEYKIFAGRVAQVGHRPVAAAGKGVSYPVHIEILDPWVAGWGDSVALEYGMSIDAKIITEQGTVYQIIRRRLARRLGDIEADAPVDFIR
jgi:multidrug efflux pump subunit AcrA (membrane-fusion protein)